MLESTDRYTATRLSAELGLDNRKMRDILTRVNPVQVKGRSKLYLLRDVIPHAAKYLGAPDVIDLNVERARKMKAEAELAEIELAKEREDLIQVDAVRQVWGELVIAAKSRLLSIPAKLAPVVAVEDAPATVSFVRIEENCCRIKIYSSLNRNTAGRAAMRGPMRAPMVLKWSELRWASVAASFS